jgi:hypothetical protein
MTLLAWRRPDEDRSHQSRRIAQSNMLTQSAPDQRNDTKLQHLIHQINPQAALRVRSKASAWDNANIVSTFVQHCGYSPNQARNHGNKIDNQLPADREIPRA